MLNLFLFADLLCAATIIPLLMGFYDFTHPLAALVGCVSGQLTWLVTYAIGGACCRGDNDDSTDVIATCAVAAREPSGSALPRRAHISDLYVEESCRRAGVATKLVVDALALARARGLECVTLEVETDNAGARRLYEKLGFRGESLRSPLAFFKYGTWAWNKDILRLDMAAGD